jgi:hypothetical protein
MRLVNRPIFSLSTRPPFSTFSLFTFSFTNTKGPGRDALPEPS